MNEERGRWYLLTGLVIGAVLGLAYAWLISPREYSDTSPASLQVDFKDQYRAMIALAYVSDGNLARARARLELLQDEDAIRSLAEQAQRTLAEGRSPREAQALGLLAVSLGQGPVPLPSLPPAVTVYIGQRRGHASTSVFDGRVAAGRHGRPQHRTLHGGRGCGWPSR